MTLFAPKPAMPQFHPVPQAIKVKQDSSTHREAQFRVPTNDVPKLVAKNEMPKLPAAEQPLPDAPKVIMSYAFLEEKPGATHIEIRLARPKPKDQAFLDHVGAEFQKTITAEIEKLRQMLEGQDGAPAAVEEPMLPVPAERFLTEPVHAR